MVDDTSMSLSYVLNSEVTLNGLILQNFVFDVGGCMFCFLLVQGLVLWIDLTNVFYVYDLFFIC